MFRKALATLLLALLSMATLAGCYRMGKATGNAAEEIEEGASDFKQGYDKGKN